MARSSTTYAPKWRCGKTRVLRVPEVLEEEVLQYAHDLDKKVANGKVREAVAAYSLEKEEIGKSLDARKPVNVSRVPQRSPFRYPGGKTWLVPYLRSWLRHLEQKPDLFIEPFAGGGIASLTAAFEQLAEHVMMAETDKGVSAVWKTILNGQGEWLAKRILEFDLTVDKVKEALKQEDNSNNISLKKRAFLTILRNRVQRGGIMAPGAGLVKSGENNKGISSRWYPETLARRIREIGMNIQRLSFFQGDGFDLLDEYAADEGAAFYIDPPYTKAARRLYKEWQIDHNLLFEKMASVAGPFLMSYDNAEDVCSLAEEFGFEHRPIRMKNTHHAEMTELLISKDFSWLDQNSAGDDQASQAKSSQKRKDLLACRR